ncbi:MAG: MFS transporter [Rhodospirillales bacterium]|jgi:MFS family permease|nr:MFS transporter [Rhodospirillales bacterium]
MPESRFPRPGHGGRALDLLNFFLANVQTGFGPFVAVYLTTQKWTEGDIGLMISVGTIVSVASQVPAGLLVDAARSKRIAAGAAIGGVMAAALLLALWPIALSVLAAEVIHGMASSVLTPAIAALSLGLVGHAALGERLGRNASFAALGNGLAAAAMGAAGSALGTRSVFWLTAGLGLPALAALAAMGRRGAPAAHATEEKERLTRRALSALLRDRRLLVFGSAIALFFLSNGAVLPLAASLVTRQAGDRASLLIAAAIVLPQAVVTLASGAVGRQAERLGRRPLLLLGWGLLPLPALLLALLPATGPLLAGQAIGGISAAVGGVMLPLIAADLSRELGHFNLCVGLFGLCAAAGATLSTALAGAVADAAGNRVAFTCLAVAGLAALALLWAAMPETRIAAVAAARPRRVDPRQAQE